MKLTTFLAVRTYNRLYRVIHLYAFLSRNDYWVNHLCTTTQHVGCCNSNVIEIERFSIIRQNIRFPYKENYCATLHTASLIVFQINHFYKKPGAQMSKFKKLRASQETLHIFLYKKVVYKKVKWPKIKKVLINSW